MDKNRPLWTLIWLLGSSFCQDYIGTRRDNTTHHVDDEQEGENDTYAMYDDVNEDEWLKLWLQRMMKMRLW